jgi:hypothetical protein
MTSKQIARFIMLYGLGGLMTLGLAIGLFTDLSAAVAVPPMPSLMALCTLALIGIILLVSMLGRTATCAILAIGLLTFAAIPSASARNFVPGTGAADCTVADPTGTPLNVRKTPPNGAIVNTLDNETTVFVMKIVLVNGKKWAHIVPENGDARLGRGHGWVFFNYLDCERSM